MQSFRLLDGLLKMGCLKFLDCYMLSFNFVCFDSVGKAFALKMSACLKFRMVSMRPCRVLDWLWLLGLSLLLLLKCLDLLRFCYPLFGGLGEFLFAFVITLLCFLGDASVSNLVCFFTPVSIILASRRVSL